MVEERLSDHDMLRLCYWLSEFKRKDQNLSYQRPNCEKSLWVFWSDPTPLSCNPNSVPPDASPSNYIKYALQSLAFYDKHLRILIQYWAPKTTIGGRCLLATSNQPFAVSKLDHKLLDYRDCSLDYEFNVDDSESEEDLGLLGRVFRHRLPELTPNVHYYSSKEYPQRQDALRCDIQWSWAFPVFEPSGQCCVGVFELVTTSAKDFLFTFEVVCQELQKVGLKGFIPFNPSSEEICNAGLLKAIKEIHEVLKAVCKKYQLPLAQTWVPCRHFSDVAYGSSPEKSGGEIMSALPSAYYISEDYAEKFQFCSEMLHLQKGQGVVGRAYMSHNSCFCGDVTQFSITEYPLAHWARYFGLASCFAICLRSTDFTGDYDYVLEFFFPPSKTDGGGDQRTLLNSLLATMKQHFPSFKIASGKDLEEELYVEFVDFLMVTVVDSLQKCRTARSPPMPEPLHDVGDMMQQLSSNQIVDFPVVVDSVQMCQTSSPEPSQNVGDMVEDDAIQNQRNVVSAEQIETAVTSYPEKEGTIDTPDTEHRTTEISISFEVIKQHFGRKLEDAAESLSVSRSTLKRICRQHGVNRWPSNKRNKNNLSISKQNPPCFHTPPEQAVATTSRTILPHEKAMEGVSTVTIKAEYRDDIIKFQLSSSSTMIEFEEKVSHRFKLNAGTFKIKYKDDTDWILINCNEDLQYCITTSRLLGSTTITMSVQPITD